MRPDLILRVIAKFVIPLIILFALYVQFHGDFGPGGGFQAGVIFGAAFILYALVFGLERAEKIIPAHWLRILAARTGLWASLALRRENLPRPNYRRTT